MLAVDFYQLATLGIKKALPKLLEKITRGDQRVVVVAPNGEVARELDSLLWVYTPLSFLPHGCAEEGDFGAADQPIWITTGGERPNDASVLVLMPSATLGTSGQAVESYQRCLYLITDAQDAIALWQAHLAQKHKLTYWTQNLKGIWEQAPHGPAVGE